MKQKSTELRKINMTEGPIVSSIIRYSLPIVISGVLQLMFNAADLIVVGRFCNDLCVGAVGSTSPLVSLLTNVFIGCGAGVAVCVANSIGSGNKEFTRKIVHTAIPLAAILGVMVTVIGLIFSRPILKLMSTPTELFPLSSLYLKIYFLGAIPNLIFEFGAAILRASGDTKSPMKYLICSGFLNVVLNVFFVTVFKMDVDGVALATITAQSLSAVLIVITLIRRKDECRLILKNIKIHFNVLKRIVKIGLPTGLQSTVFSISNIIIQSSVNSFGSADVVSGNAAAGNIEGFIYIAMNSFYQSSLNFTGQNYGAGNFKRISKILRRNLACVTVVGLLGGCTAFFLAPQLLGLYVPGNTAAIKVGITRLAFIGLPYFFCGAMEVLNGVIRGMGASMTTLIISVSCVCGIRLLWIFTIFNIEPFHTLESLYISYILSWIGSCVAQIIAYNIIISKHKKRIYAQKTNVFP